MEPIFVIAALLLVVVFALVVPTIALATFESTRSHFQGLPPEQREPAERRARTRLLITIAAIALSSVVFHALVGGQLQQTAALFVGIPTLLATGAALTPSPKSAVGVACKTVTIGLLMSLVFLGEGMICVAMSAPLFYFVAILIGLGIDRSKRSRNHMASWVALMAFVPMSLEGVTPMTSFNRIEQVSESRIVNASAGRIAAALVEQPRFERALPRYLAIGFPRPIATSIDGTRWVIRMRGGEMRLNGLEPRTGDLVLDRDGIGPGFISWRAESDDSHMTHYLNWKASRVEWQAIDATTTRVTWTLRYRRGLDPAWYFGPMERYAMHLAAGYLIESVATP